MQLDYGTDKTIGLAAMVEFARRQKGQTYERYLQKVRGMTFKNFLSSGESLENASNSSGRQQNTSFEEWSMKCVLGQHQ